MLIISILGASLSLVLLAPRCPRLHTLIGFLLLGVIAPQFVSLAHIDLIRRLWVSLTAPALPVFILLSTAVVLCLFLPRGYCRLLCPAGHLQDLVSLAVSRNATERRDSTVKLSDSGHANRPLPIGRLLLWGGMCAFILTPAFPLHHLEVFSALLFRNLGISGWLLVLALLIGSLSTHRWYCFTLCPLNHLFADFEFFLQSCRRSSSEKENPAVPSEEQAKP
ncbi:MAG TPA: 4Fe-4S binding protein [Candidatus Ozemobacteraceae bacterium]|nr:4Fe-4S binding protein [Candidatus Ozemobacteraceae bacterium]